MTANEILTRLRVDWLDDNIEPYLWSDAEIVRHLNDAADEMAEECLVILDSSTNAVCQLIIGYDGSDLDEGTNDATIKIVNDIDYTIDSVNYTLEAQDNVTMTACSQQAVSTYCKYLISADSDGNITVTKGDDASTSDDASIPALPSGQAPIGVLQIATDASHTFTSGTTDLSADGITATFLTASNPYTLHDSIVALKTARLESNKNPISIKDIVYMDTNYYGWKYADEGTPLILVFGEDNDKVWVYPHSDKPDKINLTVYRKPITEITTNDLTVSPEIPSKYHKYLLSGIAYRCSRKPDVEAVGVFSKAELFQMWMNDLEMVKRKTIKRDWEEEFITFPDGLL